MLLEKVAEILMVILYSFNVAYFVLFNALKLFCGLNSMTVRGGHYKILLWKYLQQLDRFTPHTSQSSPLTVKKAFSL